VGAITGFQDQRGRGFVHVLGHRQVVHEYSARPAAPQSDRIGQAPRPGQEIHLPLVFLIDRFPFDPFQLQEHVRGGGGAEGNREQTREQDGTQAFQKHGHTSSISAADEVN
jgi:hypothetical protein